MCGGLHNGAGANKGYSCMHWWQPVAVGAHIEGLDTDADAIECEKGLACASIEATSDTVASREAASRVGGKGDAINTAADTAKGREATGACKGAKRIQPLQQ